MKYTLYYRERYYENGKKVAGYYCNEEVNSLEEARAKAKSYIESNEGNTSHRYFDLWIADENMEEYEL